MTQPRATTGTLNGAKPRVLFVDDEKRVLNSMRALFKRDYELHLTTQGSEAIRIAEENDVDVIIADQRMPEMSGVEVLGAVRDRSPGTVRILLTGYADLDAIEGSINIGEVFRFLSKPCAPQELRETLAEAVQIARGTAPTAMRVATAGQDKKAGAGTSAAAGKDAEPAAAVSPPHRVREMTPPQIDDALDSHAETVPNLEVDPEALGAKQSKTVETEIIMAADATMEFVNTIVIEDGKRSVSRGDMEKVGVVLFTSDGEFGASAERVLEQRHTISRASTLAQVIELIGESRAGVLVTDYGSEGAMLRNMISTLKRYLPELVTIVVSDERDAAEMISLINHGQVFRYMSKPMDEGRLAHNVAAAALRHIQLRQNPELVQRHSVIPDRPPRQATALVTQFVGRIRQMRRIWRRD